jgi:hypothetical protein
MTNEKIPGYGRKRPQLNIEVDRLHLDELNPRLPETMQGKIEGEVLRTLYEEFSLEEIAISMSQNGYFDEEPLVVIPFNMPDNIDAGSEAYRTFIEKDNTHFAVVEGNRRLATIKILLDKAIQKSLGIRSWPELKKDIRDDLSILPVIVYPNRNEVVPYLGVRHITGIKKWDAYAKARYIRSMLDGGLSIEDIEQRIGDKQGSGRKNAICFSMLEQARDELDYDINKATDNFSFLVLSIGQGSIRRYLGLSSKLKDIPLEAPVNSDKLNALKNLLTWLFGEGKSIRPVIDESRDITNFLIHVVSSNEAVEYLKKTGKLQDAYELTDGEETMLKKSLASANTKLEKALGIAHRHKTPDIQVEVKKCRETAEHLFKTVNE